MEDMDEENQMVHKTMSDILQKTDKLSQFNIGDCIGRNDLLLSVVDILKEKSNIITLNISGNDVSDKNIMAGIT